MPKETLKCFLRLKSVIIRLIILIILIIHYGIDEGIYVSSSNYL